MRMIRVALIALLAVGSVTVAIGAPGGEHPETLEPQTVWGEETSGWRIGVAVCQSGFRVGEPIMLRVTTENLSEARRYADVYAFTAEGWSIEVTDLKDDEAKPYTREGQRMYGLDRAQPRGGSVSLLRLEPGGSASDVVWVNRVRDMTLTGKYSVRISRRLVTETGQWVTAEAPALQVEVKGAQYPPSALPQVVALGPESVYRTQAASALGSYLTGLAAELAHVAEREKTSQTGDAARAQLLKVRDYLEGITKERSGPPDRTVPGQEQPQEKAPQPERRPDEPTQQGLPGELQPNGPATDG